MKTLLFLMLFQSVGGTITFSGQIVSLDTPKTTQVQTADASTVASTPVLAYMSTYSNGPVKVETITYE